MNTPCNSHTVPVGSRWISHATFSYPLRGHAHKVIVWHMVCTLSCSISLAEERLLLTDEILVHTGEKLGISYELWTTGTPGTISQQLRYRLVGSRRDFLRTVEVGQTAHAPLAFLELSSLFLLVYYHRVMVYFIEISSTWVVGTCGHLDIGITADCPSLYYISSLPC